MNVHRLKRLALEDPVRAEARVLDAYERGKLTRDEYKELRRLLAEKRQLSDEELARRHDEHLWHPGFLPARILLEMFDRPVDKLYKFLVSLAARENHDEGYHVHVRVKRGRAYIRVGWVLTVKDGKVVMYAHGKGLRGFGAPGDLLSATFKRLVEKNLDIFRAFPERDWAKPVGKAADVVSLS